MENNNEITRVKKKIRDKLISEELTDIIVGLISFLILSGIFGYIGYKFCLDNGYDIQKGIVFGILFPMGIAILKETNLGNKFTYIIYVVLYFIVSSSYLCIVNLVKLSFII